MLNCRIPAEGGSLDGDPCLMFQARVDSSLTSSEDECTRRRPPKKRLRRMGEKMPLKHLEKPLTREPCTLAKLTSVNLETLKEQLDSLRTRIQLNSKRLLNNFISSEKEFTSLNATSNKNGSTSNTKINNVQRI